MTEPRLTAADFHRLRDIRAGDPDQFAKAHAARRHREILQGDGRLFIIAADHPARGALAIGSDASAMANRYDLLERLAIALSRPGVDGVLATADIIDDLALLGLLDDKVVVGSMNRGGLRGAVFEMDDRFTGYTAATMAAKGLDFAKTLLRINLSDPDTAPTLEATARAVDEAAAAKLPIMLEPFISRWEAGAIVNDLTPDAVILSVAIAAGLGGDSSRTWMKLPVVSEMERVMASTTMPTLLLGGDTGAGLDETFATWQRALALPGVRGLTVGRTLLYPPDGDVAAAVDTAARLVHRDLVPSA